MICRHGIETRSDLGCKGCDEDQAREEMEDTGEPGYSDEDVDRWAA